MPKRDLKRKDVFSQILKENKELLKIKEVDSQILHLDSKRVIIKSTITTEDAKISALGEALLEGARSDAAIRLAETRAELRAYEKLFKINGIDITLDEDLEREEKEEKVKVEKVTENQIRYAKKLIEELRKVDSEKAEKAEKYLENIKDKDKKIFSKFIDKLKRKIEESRENENKNENKKGLSPSP